MSLMLDSYSCGGFDLALELSPTLFQPTLTSRVIARNLEIPLGASVLDLGCGVGVLAVVAAKMGAGLVDALDVMPESRAIVAANAQRNGVEDIVHAQTSDLFEAVGDRRYDVVICDVSGVVDEVARMSPWYPPSIPTGGPDGADQIVRMFRQVGEHLRPGGSLYFATGTISNIPRTLEAARAVFGENVELKEQVDVPFCPEFETGIEEMTRMRDAGLIEFTTRRSRHLWTLQVYRCRK